MITIEQKIWEQAIEHPNKKAIQSGKDSASYAELTARILEARDRFQSLEAYHPGAVVLLAAQKQIEFVYAYLGAHLARLIVVPIDAETNTQRFSHIVDAVSPIAVIGFDKIETHLHKVPLRHFKSDKTNTSVSMTDLVFPNLKDVADILFTTGTTGEPKGVPLTYANESAATENINTYLQNRSDDVELLALPISHSFGLGRLRCCLTKGQTLILLGSFVNIKRLFRVMDECKVTGFSMVPASWHFLQKMSGDQLGTFSHQIKYIEMGSAYLSESDKNYLAQLLPDTRIAMHYGLTEASRSIFMEFHSDASHLSSVGKASPHTDVAIFDEKGHPLPDGQEGEICIRGAHVMHGYWKINHADCFYGAGQDYFRTGDLGYKDSDGYITLKARIKELINVGGKKVAPAEVDEKLLQIEGIEDAACIGIPDPEGILGEVVKAFIVKKPDAALTFQSIGEQLSQCLESYKLPVQYVWVDHIPKTQNGKIQRNLLA